MPSSTLRADPGLLQNRLWGGGQIEQLLHARGGIMLGNQPLHELMRRQRDSEQLERVAPGSNRMARGALPLVLSFANLTQHPGLCTIGMNMWPPCLRSVSHLEP